MMMARQIDFSEQDFLKDVATHEMHVLKDDGVYRHLRFKRPGTGCYHFDIVTYPGYLVYSGDMGCYVFSRLPDMFEFFRTPKHDWNYNKNGLSINKGYWAEKLQAMGTNGSAAEEFDEDLFKQEVMAYVKEWILDHRYDTTKDERRDLWESVISEVVEVDGDSQGMRQQVAVYDFHHKVNHRLNFYFQDFWERSYMRYTLRFVWCCYALAWGIQKYDARKAFDRKALK
jgi:hypothetical protein